ncbi:MAG: hypothetical protein IPF65_05720 [Polaromonas sp.]|nr:hypothetical protein [Polaromonas sp.]
MNWLARLKSGITLELDATKTTETIFVVSVAPTLASLQKSEGVTSAANDPAVAPTPMATDVIGTVRPRANFPNFWPHRWRWMLPLSRRAHRPVLIPMPSAGLIPLP